MMTPAQYPQPQPAPSQRNILATMFYLVGILTAGTWFVHMLWSTAHELANEARVAADEARRQNAERDGLAKPGKLVFQASSLAAAAHITLTNKETFARYMCVKGVVESKVTGAKTQTVEVCSGDLKPFTTVTLEAPYPAGSVQKLCSKTVTKAYIGPVEEFDWDLCTFDIVDTTSS